ncbi:DNA adenine methylase [Xylanibacter muris]|uniref:DNA adenine methylase n=1 Tax=Xylanibacter muris TaxID=2736290 RepID=UPI000FFECABD|nr:Dam family site-specific DNA-(adenine-N6)-methyltransferase [Xylanibacter muris]RXE70081.1 Dam family site-specific DNA-(adenine-N6)-methyltransferase [Muribaculaceae bacterium Isolate-002 (NCI)]
MKPFVKWAGGKTRLLKEIERRLPADFDEWKNATYVEPFVGGGSVLFHMLKKYNNITRAVINDINPVLMHAYEQIKDNPSQILTTLMSLRDEYCSISDDKAREYFYYRARKTFNAMRFEDEQKVSFFIFLNHTCFNGLYRENGFGEFNVPHGRYKSPTIFEEDNFWTLHECLQKVEINCGDFGEILRSIGNESTFIYMDPPYRPVSKEITMFTLYDKSGFKDLDQIRLKEICDVFSNQGCKIMLSNSDSYDDNVSFFENLYSNGYNIDRVKVTRMINPYNSKNRNPKEVIITNYPIPNNINEQY